MYTYIRKEIKSHIMKKNKITTRIAAKKSIGCNDASKRKSAEFGNDQIESVNENISAGDQKSSKNLEEIESSPILRPGLDQKAKFFDELVRREGSVEKLLQIRNPAKTVYDVDRMSSTEIRESLARIDDKTIEPFNFLAEIFDGSNDDRSESMRDDKNDKFNPTDIDLQLASLLKRVELNKTLLEKANQRIKDINFLTERNKMVSLRETNYDEKSFLDIKEAGDANQQVSVADLKTVLVTHPAVDELRKTMNATIEMLGYVQKMSNVDLASGEIPPELKNYLSGSIITRDE